MVTEFLTLEWDTQFFGFTVAKCVVQNFSSEDLHVLQKKAHTENITLTYISCEQDDTTSTQTLLEALPLLDEKTLYIKALDATDKIDNTVSVTSILGQPSTPQLVSLAIQSGQFSRYKIDENIDLTYFEKLYELWLELSLNGTKAWEVLVTTENDQPTGFVTLENKDGIAAIGLLAVDERHRGKGLGKQLVQAAINAALQQGYREMHIATQGKNTPACVLYESFGFQKHQIVNVFHLWSNFTQI